MSIELPPEIQQANAYLRAGQRLEARSVLLQLVRRQPDSELGWLMLSRTMDDPTQQADCLRQALRINPQNSGARSFLETLTRTSSSGTLSGQPPQAANLTPEPPKPEYPVWAPPPPPLFTPAEKAAAAGISTSATYRPVVPTERVEVEPAVPAAEKPASRVTKGNVKSSKPGGSSKKKTGLLIGCGVVAALLVCVAGGLMVTQLAPGLLAARAPAQPAAGVPQAQAPNRATPVPTWTARPLPPTWTPTLSPTPTATHTVTPTPAPSLTPTYPAPPPTAAALMARIEQEVSDLRGLPIQTQPPRYVMSPAVVEQMLKRELEAGDGIEQLKDEARTLVALGLIKPTYDLVRYAMNGLVDSIGGFYRPDSKEIYILGLRFGGVEHISYSHEFDHALVDQTFNLTQLDKDALCETNSDRCEANKALIEGDATLLMMQWLKQYGSPQDFRDILTYRPPFRGMPEQFPPDYVAQAMGFPYESGMVFVNKFYEEGNWARVNQLYAKPPISTEQILHPEKYLSGEAPIELQDPSLEVALGKPWRRISNDVLGEWNTYLILAFGADKPSRRSPEVAKRATDGWGGDQSQVIFNDETEQWAMADHWIWDSPKDAAEFEQASQEYLGQMLRGAQVSRPSGTCWQSNGQVACLYAKGNETLWLVTTDQATLDPLALLFSGLTTP
jgi:hypothetical protein